MIYVIEFKNWILDGYLCPTDIWRVQLGFNLYRELNLWIWTIREAFDTSQLILSLLIFFLDINQCNFQIK